MKKLRRIEYNLKLQRTTNFPDPKCHIIMLIQKTLYISLIVDRTIPKKHSLGPTNQIGCEQNRDNN